MATMIETKDALERVSDLLSNDPDRGNINYNNKASIKEGTVCTVVDGKTEMVFDVSKSMGGEGAGLSPSLVLRSALTSCVAIGIKLWAARKSVVIDSVEVSLDANIDSRGQFGLDETKAPGFEDLILNIDVKSKVSKKIVEEVIQTSLRYSPLMDAYQTPQLLETNINFQ